ncbi:unnamed protein product, partial [Owenia fusiformis]
NARTAVKATDVNNTTIYLLLKSFTPNSEDSQIIFDGLTVRERTSRSALCTAIEEHCQLKTPDDKAPSSEKENPSDFYCGIFKVDVRKLTAPSWERSVRPPDPNHVQSLKETFLKNPSGYFHLILVNVPNVKQFTKEVISRERTILEVIGGNHSREAFLSILNDDTISEHVKNMFRFRDAIVYCGLPNHLARHLANLHNIVRKSGKEESYMENICEMRAALYQLSGKSEIETTTVDPPNDRKLVEAWKATCQQVRGIQKRRDFNNSYGVAIRIAQWPTESFQELKHFDIKWRKGEITKQPKQPKGKTVLKKHHIACLLTPPLEDATHIIRQCIDGQIDYNQLRLKCTNTSTEETPRAEHVDDIIEEIVNQDEHENVSGPKDDTVVDKLKVDLEVMTTKYLQCKQELTNAEQNAMRYKDDLARVSDNYSKIEKSYLDMKSSLRKSNKDLTAMTAMYTKAKTDLTGVENKLKEAEFDQKQHEHFKETIRQLKNEKLYFEKQFKRLSEGYEKQSNVSDISEIIPATDSSLAITDQSGTSGVKRSRDVARTETDEHALDIDIAFKSKRRREAKYGQQIDPQATTQDCRTGDTDNLIDNVNTNELCDAISAQHTALSQQKKSGKTSSREIVCARWEDYVFLGVKEDDLIYYCQRQLSKIDEFNKLLRISKNMCLINKKDQAKVGVNIAIENFFVVQSGFLNISKNSLIITLMQDQAKVISCLSSIVSKL